MMTYGDTHGLRRRVYQTEAAAQAMAVRLKAQGYIVLVKQLSPTKWGVELVTHGRKGPPKRSDSQ